MPLLSSALLELWLGFWLSNLPMDLLVAKVILMRRFFNSFVMNLVSLPTYVNFAHLRKSLLSFGSGVPCRSVCLSILSSICDGLYLLFQRICRNVPCSCSLPALSRWWLFILLTKHLIAVFQIPTYCTIYLLDKTHAKIRTSNPWKNFNITRPHVSILPDHHQGVNVPIYEITEYFYICWCYWYDGGMHVVV